MADLKPASYRAIIVAISLLPGLFLWVDMIPGFVLIIIVTIIFISMLIVVRKIEGKLTYPKLPWWLYVGVLLCVLAMGWFVLLDK